MPSRRSVLLGVGAAAAGTAGCTFLDDSDSTETATETPAGTPTKTPTQGPAERQIPGDWQPDPGTWATATYSPANTSYNPHASPPQSKPEMAWSGEVPGAPSIAVADGVVYLRGAKSLIAVNDADASQKWSIDRPRGDLLGCIEGRLYDKTDGQITAFTTEGDEEWTADFEGSLYALFEMNGQVYIATTGGIQRHHADTGEHLDDLTTVGSPGLRDGTIYGVSDGDLAAYRVPSDSLSEQWRLGAEALDLQYGGVAVGSDAAYLLEIEGADDGTDELLRVDREDGTEAGTYDVRSVLVSPAVADDRIYISEAEPNDDGSFTDGKLIAADDSGERWSRDSKSLFGPALATDDAVLVGRVPGGDEPLYALDPATGETLWQYGDSGAPLAVVDDTVYATVDGKFVALR